MRKKQQTAIAFALIASAAMAAEAGVITYVPFNDDASSGISTANTYTHAIDAGDANGVTVNGVFFTPYEPASGLVNAPQPFQHNGTASVASGEGGGSPIGIPAGQNTRELMADFLYGGSTTDDSIVSGLTPGVTYDARVYIRSWASVNREIAIVFDEDGVGPLAATTGLLNEDDARSRGFNSQSQPYYINYRYTATDQPLRIVVASPAVDQYHFFAFSNQVVPEPAALSLLGLGSIGLLARRRRA